MICSSIHGHQKFHWISSIILPSPMCPATFISCSDSRICRMRFLSFGIQSSPFQYMHPSFSPKTLSYLGFPLFAFAILFFSSIRPFCADPTCTTPFSSWAIRPFGTDPACTAPSFSSAFLLFSIGSACTCETGVLMRYRSHGRIDRS